MKRRLKITMTRLRRQTLKVPMVFVRVQCPECGCEVKMHGVPADRCQEEEVEEQSLLVPALEDDPTPDV